MAKGGYTELASYYCGKLGLTHVDSTIQDLLVILPNCPLDDELYDLGPDLEKAILIMKRLIKSNSREGWEDTEHYNTVLLDAVDFLSNFEIMEEVDKTILESNQGN